MKRALVVMVAGLILLTANAYSMDNSQKQSITGKQMNINKSEAFLTENKNKPKVVTLPSGLQYKIEVSGKGEKPNIGDTVTVHYSGTLIDDTEFDSSYKRGTPATFPVNGVIQGWVEALQLMNKGSIWHLYIPANLAYGERGAPPSIGPNETLIFKVELLNIQK